MYGLKEIDQTVSENSYTTDLHLNLEQLVPVNIIYTDLFSATSTGGVPTPAALKAGVGFPLGLRKEGVVNRGIYSSSVL